MLRVAIASDHAGFSLKMVVKEWMTRNHYTIFDNGCHNNEIVDYPDFVKGVISDIKDNIVDYGVLICGSGIGMSMAANRFVGIRAALCHTVDAARLARDHNNANVICLGSVLTEPALTLEILKAFFKTEFSEGRHTLRTQKLDQLGGN